MITFAALLGYSRSRYYPFEESWLHQLTTRYPLFTRGISYTMLSVALVLYVWEMGVFTGLSYWITGLMLALSALLLILPVYSNIKKGTHAR